MIDVYVNLFVMRKHDVLKTFKLEEFKQKLTVNHKVIDVYVKNLRFLAAYVRRIRNVNFVYTLRV